MSYELRWVAPQGAHDESSYDVVKDGKVVGSALSRGDAENIRINMAAKEANKTNSRRRSNLLDEYENNDNKANNKNQKVNTQSKTKQKTATVEVVGVYFNGETIFEPAKNTNEAGIEVLNVDGGLFKHYGNFAEAITDKLFDLQDKNKKNPFNYIQVIDSAKFITQNEIPDLEQLIEMVEENWNQDEEFDDVLSETTLTIHVKALFD
mgnify:CR=1 FL=1